VSLPDSELLVYFNGAVFLLLRCLIRDSPRFKIQSVLCALVTLVKYD